MRGNAVQLRSSVWGARFLLAKRSCGASYKNWVTFMRRIGDLGFACCVFVCCCMWLCCVVCVLCVLDGGEEGCMHRARLRVYVQNTSHVYIQNVSVCTGTTPTCFIHVGRGASTHGDVSNVHMGVFSACHTTHHNTTQHNTTQHNTTRTTHQHTTHINLLPPKTVEWSLRVDLFNTGKLTRSRHRKS